MEEEDLPILSVEGGRQEENGYIPITVRLSEPATDAVTVDYRTLSGTALAEGDVYSYSSNRLAGTLTFAPGEEVKTLFLLVDNESEDEIDENVLLEIHDPEGAILGGGNQSLTAIGWALDNDGVGLNRALAVSSPVVLEGANREAVFTVSLSEAFDTARSFAFSTFGGTATAGSDFTARSGTVNFAAGQTEAFVAVDLLNDSAVEGAETFGLSIDAANGVAGAVGTARILNDDGPRPVLSVEGGRQGENGYIPITVRLSEPATDAVTVSYRTLSGTALAEGDVYSYSSNRLAGTLTFAPGEEVKTLFLLVDNESEDEIDENVLLEIHDPEGAILGGGNQSLTAIGWALDNDGVGLNRALAVSSPVVLEGNAAVFDVELSQASTAPITITYQTASGGATAGRDFVAERGQITFAAGQTRAQVTVELAADRLRETAESFNLVITSYPSQISAQGGRVVGRATIVDGTIRGSSGDNRLNGTDAVDRIEGLGGDDVLRGLGGNDLLLGGSGDDVLNGGTGADRMAGEGGDDTYFVDSRRDTVEERARGGTDEVRGALTWTLSANVENLTLTGRGGVDGAGNGLANRITGNSGANTLAGLSGDDWLDGGAGADRLVGGRGDDAYVIDSLRDTLVEGASRGVDTVATALDWTLALNFENLTLRGSADLRGSGNGAANRIVGNAGDNSLHGGGGADTIIGGAGNDRITGGAGPDALTGGAGSDRFIFASASDTGLGGRRDVIRDFAARRDKIDLGAIDANEGRRGPQAFHYIGAEGFSESAGEIRFANEILSADTDGDGRSDFQIELAGLARLHGADLIL